MTVTRLSPGRWRLDWYDAAGRRRRMTVRAPTKEAAARCMAEIQLDATRQRSGLEPQLPNPRRWTVADMMRWWMTRMEQRHASPKRTASGVRCLILNYALAEHLADRVTRGAVDRHLDLLEADGFAASSVNHARRYLQAAFASAIRDGQIAIRENPVSGSTIRQVRRRHLETLTHAEVRRLLAVVEDPTRAIYAVAIYAGLRRGEIWALRRSDLDTENNTITVSRSNARAVTKGGSVRVIPIHAELRAHLARILLSHSHELVFVSPVTGGLRSEDAKTSRDLAAALQRAGITRTLRFHDLRHTCATLLLQAGVSLAVVQRVLGHSTPILTANTYGHLATADIAREMDRLHIGDAEAEGGGVQILTGTAGFLAKSGVSGRRGER